MSIKGIAVTGVVWAAALGSAAALAFALNRPLQPRPIEFRAPSLPTTSVESAPVPVTESVLVLPPTTIVARIAKPARLADSDLKPEVSRDISAMRCGQWRELDMGSGHVQICE